MSGRWTYRSFSIVTHKHIALKLVAEGQSALIEGSVVLIMHGLMGLERRRSRGGSNAVIEISYRPPIMACRHSYKYVRDTTHTVIQWKFGMRVRMRKDGKNLSNEKEREREREWVF